MAAFDKPMFIGGIISHRVVNRSHVVPHQYVTDGPEVTIAKLGLQLMLKQEVQNLVAFFFGQLVNTHGIAGVCVQNFVACDGVG